MEGTLGLGSGTINFLSQIRGSDNERGDFGQSDLQQVGEKNSAWAYKNALGDSASERVSPASNEVGAADEEKWV